VVVELEHAARLLMTAETEKKPTKRMPLCMRASSHSNVSDARRPRRQV